jgi:hypothetical protein
LLVAPRTGSAHWCDDLWDSAYNVVVRPTSDVVDVPASGNASLTLHVQNNMGYPLVNFTLSAQASGYTITATKGPVKVDGYLMPGEKTTYTLAIKRSGGSGSLAVERLTFYVGFGNNVNPRQDRYYGDNGTGVMIKKASGALAPAAPVPKVTGVDQSQHLNSSANADYGDLEGALDALLAEYCAGRSSWDRNNGRPISRYCPSATAPICPTTATTADGSKYDYQHLWAAGELAYRKAALGSRAAVFRERLRCGFVDNALTFKAFTGFVLGYLGEDDATRRFLELLVQNGVGDEKIIAKAALVVMGKSADLTAYRSDLKAAVNAGSDQVKMVAAAALGIADRDDASVEAGLIGKARWVEPDTFDEGRNMMAAHLLNLVAWDRRGWAAHAGDVGGVSFYPDSSGNPSSSGGSTSSSSGSGSTSGSSGSGSTSSSSGSGSTSGSSGSGSTSSSSGSGSTSSSSGSGSTSSSGGGSTTSSGGGGSTSSSGAASEGGGTVSGGCSHGAAAGMEGLALALLPILRRRGLRARADAER